jgi:hypothetical protein
VAHGCRSSIRFVVQVYKNLGLDFRWDEVRDEYVLDNFDLALDVLQGSDIESYLRHFDSSGLNVTYCPLVLQRSEPPLGSCAPSCCSVCCSLCHVSQGITAHWPLSFALASTEGHTGSCGNLLHMERCCVASATSTGMDVQGKSQ